MRTHSQQYTRRGTGETVTRRRESRTTSRKGLRWHSRNARNAVQHSDSSSGPRRKETSRSLSVPARPEKRVNSRALKLCPLNENRYYLEAK